MRDFFQIYYRNVDIGEGSDIFVIDSTGTVVSSRNPNIEITKNYKDQSLTKKIDAISKQGKNVFNLDIEDNRYLVAFSTIKGTDWYVVSTIPFSYLNSESKKIGMNIIMLGIGCFLAAILLSYVFSRSISSPLKKLVKAMNEAKKGNLSIIIKDNNRDEIGEVTGNFNNMLNEIKNLLDNVKSKERQKRNAELKALQAQINPHFLSNTLNTVKWLANVQKAENVENIVTSLIQLLHISMGKGDDTISIKEELEYIKNYINIQEYRYYNKFKVNYEIEEEILDFKIPKLILQPIVENSLIHGIGPMEGLGIIAVKGFKYEGDIKITVTDNGLGIHEDKLDKLLEGEDISDRSRFSGIGISNVNERIKMYFGDKYGLHIESVPNLFTTIEITIPISNKE